MLIHWIWLATRPNLHERDKLALLQYFHDPEDIFYAEADAYAAVEGISREGVEALSDKSLKQAHAIVRECTAKNIHICTFGDAAYPNRLKNISDPPMVFYYKGRLPDLDSVPVIAVVGTRDASAYGMNAARRMGGQICKCGGIVVSGMAAGIDGAAVSGALSADGIVIGVLGSGADIVYPRSNRSLFDDTERYGCLISEFPPGTPPMKWNFPKRNRIMSGISNGVLVVEAPHKSGALITARQAMEQGRDVFVVPGNIGVAACEGSNALMKDGAAVVTCGWDVLEEYAHVYPGKLKKKSAAEPVSDKISVDKPAAQPYIDPEISCDLDDTERKLLEHLTGRMLMDALIAEAALDSSEALAALTLLEVKGLVCTLPGGWVERA